VAFAWPKTAHKLIQLAFPTIIGIAYVTVALSLLCGKILESRVGCEADVDPAVCAGFGAAAVDNCWFGGGGCPFPPWVHWLSGRHNAHTSAIAAPSRIGRRKTRRAVICNLFRQYRPESKRCFEGSPMLGGFCILHPADCFRHRDFVP
jgi:hypothetical protein